MINLARHWLSILVLPVIWSLLTTPASQNLRLLISDSRSNRPSNVLLLTAHPDDECMFFAPTILALLESPSKPPPTLYSLCLSVGNADGLGDVRRHELSRSLDVLGIREGRRWVIDTPKLQDNFTAEWDAHVIADVLRPYVLDNHITTILTFDLRGISSHLNHISLPKGASHMLSSFPPKSEQSPRLFSLVTVSLLEKYFGPLSPLLSKASIALHGAGVSATRDSTEMAVAVSGLSGYARAHRAMREHWSQLVWFRWLYVSFSRYMWVNEWVEILPTSEARTASGAKS